MGDRRGLPLGLTAKGVLQEGVAADGVKDRVECPVDGEQNQQQQQDR